MIRCFNYPWLTDFIQVCAQMPQDEREQLEAFTGEPYGIDGAAVGNFAAPGPKWVIKVADSDEAFAVGNSRPIVLGGFVPQRPGVYRDFLLTTPEAWSKEYGFTVTRICRRIMDAILLSGTAHRLECIVPAARVESRPELAKWYKVLGYTQEGRHHGYCASGADAISFARVKH
jgi:hypothetical protein